VRNQVAIDGRLLKRSALRYTPAGIPAIDMVIGHNSIQIEAGGERQTRCEIETVAIGDVAVRLRAHKLNQILRVRGFLSRRSLTNQKLVLHVVEAKSISNE